MSHSRLPRAGRATVSLQWTSSQSRGLRSARALCTRSQTYRYRSCSLTTPSLSTSASPERGPHRRGDDPRRYGRLGPHGRRWVITGGHRPLIVSIEDGDSERAQRVLEARIGRTRALRADHEILAG